ncbi:hypothetical protein PIB30_046816 [Stylosanthes scabra]|uniref:Uncharacterized protein n=1 Tax=Stylosanthes scabra TaxID=79078 RepID=A0ABU6SGF5_9FABA|nr:hypothetical protein [Stylosanthes scabra]
MVELRRNSITVAVLPSPKPPLSLNLTPPSSMAEPTELPLLPFLQSPSELRSSAVTKSRLLPLLHVTSQVAALFLEVLVRGLRKGVSKGVSELFEMVPSVKESIRASRESIPTTLDLKKMRFWDFRVDSPIARIDSKLHREQGSCLNIV